MESEGDEGVKCVVIWGKEDSRQRKKPKQSYGDGIMVGIFEECYRYLWLALKD